VTQEICCPKCHFSSVQNHQLRPKLRPNFSRSSTFSPAIETKTSLANGQICTDFQVCIKKCSISLYYLFHWKVSAFNVCTNFVLRNQHIACTAQARCRLNRHSCVSITPHRKVPRMIDVTMWSQQFDAFAHFVTKLIHSHLNNSRHPFFQPNCKSITVMPMNVKEFDNFFWRSVGHFSFRFPPKLWNSFYLPEC